MQLIYENELGRVCMGGGKNRTFNITNITGLSIPQTDAETVTYPGVPGRSLISISVLPRTITITGDVKDKSGREVSFGATVFSKPGDLYVITNRNKRKISCRCTSFMPEKRRGIFVPFSMQLVCDNPYFEDAYKIREDVLKKYNLLSGEFVLPKMFSRRTAEAKIINLGSVLCEPVFEISAKEYAQCPEGIVIQNHTTGNSLTLITDIYEGEKITVDIKNRKITSNLRGNLIRCLQKSCTLSGLYLETGTNDVAVTANNEAVAINVCCIYKNSYAEAGM